MIIPAIWSASSVPHYIELPCDFNVINKLFGVSKGFIVGIQKKKYCKSFYHDIFFCKLKTKKSIMIYKRGRRDLRNEKA